jgi:GGDEF domain-containing protein
VLDVTETLVERIEIVETPRSSATASDLIFESMTVPPTVCVSEVAQMFRDQAALQTLPVVENDRPVGVIRRSELLDILSLPLRQELFGRKPIVSLMDRNPLLVDCDLRLEQVSRIVTRGYQERLQEQFVITRNGRYLGMGRVIDLLRAITEEQIQSARHSNPLTALPGNIPIYDCVNGLLRREKNFVLCHIDIDNFKPFNDFYGYSKGDEALVGLSRILVAITSPRVDFVGHVGGDDFVAVFRSDDWQERVDRLFGEVEQAFRSLYRPEHIEQNGIVTRDRYGLERQFPLLSISVAAIVCNGDSRCGAEDLAYMIAPIKLQAKQKPGNALVLEECANLIAAEAEFDDLFVGKGA